METEQQPEKNAPKTYAFRYPPLTLAVLILGLVLCVTGVALTTWQFVGFLQGDISSVYDWLKYVLLYFVSILLAVLIIAMLLRSRYIVTDTQLILQFGIIKSKYALKSIFSVKLFKGSHKLTVYFDDFKTSYMIIVVKEEWYDDFIQTLIARNERIGFDYVTAEEENEWKKKK